MRTVCQDDNRDVTAGSVFVQIYLFGYISLQSEYMLTVIGLQRKIGSRNRTEGCYDETPQVLLLLLRSTCYHRSPFNRSSSNDFLVCRGRMGHGVAFFVCQSCTAGRRRVGSGSTRVLVWAGLVGYEQLQQLFKIKSF